MARERGHKGALSPLQLTNRDSVLVCSRFDAAFPGRLSLVVCDLLIPRGAVGYSIKDGVWIGQSQESTEGHGQVKFVESTQPFPPANEVLQADTTIPVPVCLSELGLEEAPFEVESESVIGPWGSGRDHPSHDDE